jgi:putative DNA primase/helicase
MGNLSFLRNFEGLDDMPSPEPVETQVRVAMQMAGIKPPQFIQVDGNLYRYPTNDDSKDDSGWYCIHPDGVPAGRFGCFRSGIEQTFRANIGRPLSPDEERNIYLRQEAARHKRDADKAEKQKAAAQTVDKIWSSGLEADANHPYLVKKGIKPSGARIHGDGRLIVPLYDASGTLTSLQYISPTGEKRYHPGGKVGGCFWSVGGLDMSKKLYIAEGFATAATVFEETGLPCVVAYSAGNLPSVVGAIRELAKTAELIIVADNDKSGTGQAYANQAAAKYGASVIMPPQVGQDVNDYRAAGGDVRQLLEPKSDIFDKLGVVKIGDLDDEYQPPDEIIQDLLTAEKVSVVYGASNSGKTFWVISMAAAIVENKPFHGRLVDGGAVVYIAAESPGGVKDRMKAYRKHFGSQLNNLYMVSVPLNFHDDPSAAVKMVTLCNEIESQSGQSVRLVIGDTLARMSAGANENSGEDMGPVMAQFDIVTRETGAAVLVIHHSGKDQAKGSRGWSGIQAHIDTEFEVIDDKGVKSATVTKQRDGPKGFSLYFKLHVIEVGIGKFGDMKTTCVAIPDEETQKNDPNKKPDKESIKMKEEKDLFEAAWIASGCEMEDGFPFFTVSSFREYLRQIYGDKTAISYAKSSHAQFKLKNLKSNGVISVTGEKIKLIDDVISTCLKSVITGHKRS